MNERTALAIEPEPKGDVMPGPCDEVTAMPRIRRGARRVRWHLTRWHLILCLLVSVLMVPFPTAAHASVAPPLEKVAHRSASVPLATAAGAEAATGATTLESVAKKAGETGRNVAMSLIGLALAIAAVVLAFRRDFREAAAVFAVGIVCVLLAAPAGESLLRETVNALVGS